MPLDRETENLLTFARNLSMGPFARAPVDKETRDLLTFARDISAELPAVRPTGMPSVAQQEQARKAARDRAMLIHARKELAESYLPGTKAAAIQAGADIVAPMARLFRRGEYADRMHRFGDAIEQAIQEREKGGVVPDILQRGARGAYRSLVTAAPAAAVAGPYGAITAFAGQEADRAITKGRDRGLKGSRLAEYAVSQGVVEAVPAAFMQRIGLGGVESLLSKRTLTGALSGGVREGLKRLGITYLQEWPEEQVTELAHNVADWLYNVDPNALTLENIRRTVDETTVQTGFVVAFAGAPGVARSMESGRVAQVAEEMETYAREGKVPSRKTWRKWGLAPKMGETRRQRKAFTLLMATQLQPEAAPEAATEPVGPEGVIEPQVALEAVAEPVAAPTAALEAEVEPTPLPKEKKLSKRAEREARAAKILHEMERIRAEIAAEKETPAAEQEVIPPTEVPALGPTVAVEPGEAPPGEGPKGEDMITASEGTEERIGGREVVRRLEGIWGIPVRRGRISQRKARAIYKTFPQVARLKKGEEASPAVAMHELAHHLDNTTSIGKGISGEAAAELQALDYDATKARLDEGFAEFVRGYLTGSTARIKGIDLNREAPEFLRLFEEWLSRNPEVQKRINASREIITQFREAGAIGRVKGQISEAGIDISEERRPIMERLDELKEYLYTRVKEEIRPVKRFVMEAERRGYDPGEETDPFETLSALRQIGPHFAASAIEEGVFRLSDMKKIGPSLAEALEEISDDADHKNFTAWAYARSAIESWKKGKNPGITLKDAEEVVKQLYDPRYERAADKFTEFLNSTVDVLVDAGVIEEAEGKKVKEYYEYYIPLRRARKGVGIGGARRMIDLSAALKGRVGSGLQIIDPFESALAMTIERYERAAKQIVIDKLAEVAESTEGMGTWMEKVPPKVLKTAFKLADVKKQLADIIKDELGNIGEESAMDAIDELLDAIDPMAALSIWRPDLMKVRDQPIVRVTVKGERKFYQLHPELYAALGGIDTLGNLDVVTQTFKSLNRLMKWGATRANPSFQATNALKDLQVFLMQGEKGLGGAVDPVEFAIAYVMSEVQRARGEKRNPIVELYQKMGGELSTFLGLDRDRLRGGVRRARAGKPGAGSTILSILSTTEVASRIAEFSAILEKEGWLKKVEQGETPPMSVLIRAINAAHDVTTDFRRMGKWGRYLNYYIPFFNAQLEGLDKTIRTFKKYPGRTMMRIILNRVPLALVYWWYRHDDDDYKERPEWQDSYYVFTDKEGNPVYRIPKPHEWGLIDSAIERMMDSLSERDPEAIERWGKQVFRTAMPNKFPAGITPIAESLFNYDLFRERPVVSQQLEKYEKPEQYYEYTTTLAKEVSRFLHDRSGGAISLSPAKMDHLANGLTGGMYRRTIEPTQKIIEGDEWTARDVPGLKGVTLRKEYAKSIDDFYSEREALSKLHESNKLKARPEPEDLDRWRRMENVGSLITAMRKAARTLPWEERESTDLALIGLTRAALEREPLKRYPNPFISTKELPEVVEGEVEKHIAQKAIAATRGGRKPEAIQKSKDATEYLRSMGAKRAFTERVMYSRLRAQGVKIETIKKRKRRLLGLHSNGR